MTSRTAPRSVPSADGVVVTSRWQVAGRHAQRATADAAMAQWRHSPWPEGCRSLACFLSTDGQLVMFYGQWADEPAYRRHAASDDILDPEATHLDTVVSTPVAPPASRPDDGPLPGCVVLVSIATDGPERQREAAARIAAFAADPHPGAIGGQLLFSLDGSRVTLYAEWTSEEAHREAIDGSAYGGQRGIFDGTPGIRGLSMHRYQLYRRAADHPQTP